MKKILAILFFIFWSSIVWAQSPQPSQIINGTEIKNNINTLTNVTPFNPKATIGTVMGMVIYAFLGLLGIIFVVLIILAGFNWMTAAGDEDKVEKAQQTIQRAIIGLVIILAAYAITYFVFQSLVNLTESPGGGQVGG